jgi:hypothetical protein
MALNTTKPKDIIPWFKQMNIKIDDLMSIIHEKYNIDKNMLAPYQVELNTLITESEDLTTQYESDKPVVFSEKLKNLFLKFQQEHNKLFNRLIIKINDTQ